MAEGFVFFAAVLAQGFLCAKLLPRKYNDMEKGILVGAAEIAFGYFASGKKYRKRQEK